MSVLLGNYSRRSAALSIYTLMLNKKRPLSLKQIANSLEIPYSTVTSSIAELVAYGDIEFAFEQANQENPRAKAQKFYQLPTASKSKELDFPWKINPKGYNNGYETQPC